ncbi:hypothetical protein [Parageobacillus toebii]|uniref:hypothetical protein n=1 Tax=Parageobacillus toebii TaxID=153151 RepID=UPI0035B55ECF
MKKMWLSFVAVMMLIIPTEAFAAHEKANVKQQDTEAIGHVLAGHMFKHGELDEQKWMEIVRQYTPDQADEWQKVLDERKALRKQMQDEQVKKALKAKCEEMKRKREAALDQLIDRFASKEISKKQFKKELKQLHKRKKWMSKDEKQKLRELHHQTYEAMKEKDKNAMTMLLQQWLEHMKKENERLAKSIQEATQR